MTVAAAYHTSFRSLEDYLTQRKLEPALAVFDSLLQNYPDQHSQILLNLEQLYLQRRQNGFWHMFMTQVYLRLKQFDQLVEEIESIFPQYVDSSFYSKLITQIFAWKPGHVGLRQLLDRVYRKQGLPDELVEILVSMLSFQSQSKQALSIAEDLMHRQPHQIRYQKMYLALLIQAEHYSQAQEQYEQLRKKNMVSLEDWIDLFKKSEAHLKTPGLFLWAQAYVKALKPDLAVEIYDRLYNEKNHETRQALQEALKKFLETYPSYPSASFLAVQLEIDQEYYSEAVARLNALAKQFPAHRDQIVSGYQSILKVCPEQILARQSLVEIFLSQNHFESALEQLSAVLEISQDSAEWVQSRVKRILKKHPESILARAVLAKCLLAQSQHRAAIAEAEHLLELAPESSLGYEILGKSYSKIPDYSKAWKYLSHALKFSPFDRSLHEALEQVGQARCDALILKIAKEVEQEGLNIFKLFDLGKVYFQRNFLEEAIAKLQLVTRDTDLSSRAHHYLGICYKEKGRFDLAVLHFKKAMEMDVGRDPQFYEKMKFYLGLSYEGLGEIERAVDLYEQISSESFPSLSLRTDKLKKMSWSDKRGRALSAVLKDQSSNQVLLCWAKNNEISESHTPSESFSAALELNNQGVNYALKGRLQLAEQKFREAAQKDSQLTIVHNNLAVLYLQAGSFREAHENLEKALQLNPKIAVLYANLGLLLHLQGQFQKGVSYYQKALGFDDTLYTLQINFGDALYRLDSIEKAISLWETALYLGILPELAKRRLQYRKVSTDA